MANAIKNFHIFFNTSLFVPAKAVDVKIKSEVEQLEVVCDSSKNLDIKDSKIFKRNFTQMF